MAGVGLNVRRQRVEHPSVRVLEAPGGIADSSWGRAVGPVQPAAEVVPARLRDPLLNSRRCCGHRVVETHECPNFAHQDRLGSVLDYPEIARLIRDGIAAGVGVQVKEIKGGVGEQRLDVCIPSSLHGLNNPVIPKHPVASMGDVHP